MRRYLRISGLLTSYSLLYIWDMRRYLRISGFLTSYSLLYLWDMRRYLRICYNHVHTIMPHHLGGWVGTSSYASNRLPHRSAYYESLWWYVMPFSWQCAHIQRKCYQISMTMYGILMGFSIYFSVVCVVEGCVWWWFNALFWVLDIAFLEHILCYVTVTLCSEQFRDMFIMSVCCFVLGITGQILFVHWLCTVMLSVFVLL